MILNVNNGFELSQAVLKSNLLKNLSRSLKCLRLVAVISGRLEMVHKKIGKHDWPRARYLGLIRFIRRYP